MIVKAQRKIVKLIRESWFNILYTLFNYIPYRIRVKRGTKLLIYHGICKTDALKFNSRFLNEKLFEEHLLAIKKCYNPVSFDDFKEGKLSANNLNVLLTFDDGLRNNFEYALPLLRKHSIPAVFFVTLPEGGYPYLFNDVLDVFSLIGPGTIKLNEVLFVKRKKAIHYRYVNAEGVLLANYFHATNEARKNEIMRQIFEYVPLKEFAKYGDHLNLLSEEDIKKMAVSDGITLGTHGVSHSDFTVLNPEELQSELKRSREKLEKITGRPSGLVAFPYGHYNQDTLKYCKHIGYKDLFGTEKLLAEQDRSVVIERFTVNPFTSSINQMYYIAKGNYE